MFVHFCWKEKNGKCYRLVERAKVKDARKIFKEKYKNDDNVIKVWLSHFGEWHEYCHSILKDLEENKK